MKLKLSLLLLLISHIVFGQDSPYIKPVGYTNQMAAGYQFKQVKVDSSALIKKLLVKDTAAFQGRTFVPNALSGDSNKVAVNTGYMKKWIAENVTPGVPGQPTSAWGTGGNYSPVDPTPFRLGFKDAINLHFITNNTIRATIPSGGINRSVGAANKVVTIDTMTKALYYTDMASGGGGGGTSAKAYAPLLVRNDSVYQRFNVRAYGATGDSTQDATPYIQAAIDACILAGGGEVFFPNGFYWCSSALVTSRNGVIPNAQIVIPPVDYSNKTRTHISFVGETAPNYTPALLYVDSTYPRTGVVIKSTITGSGTLPAVFGGIGTVGNNFFTYHYVSFKNITLLVKANAGGTGPTMTAINGGRFASLEVDNCVIGIDTSLYRDTIPQNQVAGIITTLGTGETFSHVCNSMVYGFRYGVVAGEHCFLNNVQAFGNYASFVPNGHPSGGHPVYGTKLLSSWAKYDVLIPNVSTDVVTAGFSNFKFDLLSIETYNNGVRWFNNVASVADSGNRAHGVFDYSIIASPGSTGNSSFLMYNGTSIYPRLFSTRPLAVNSSNILTSATSVLGIQGTANMELNVNSTSGGTPYVSYASSGDRMWYTRGNSTKYSILNSDANGTDEVLAISQAGAFTFSTNATNTVATFNNASGSGNMVVNYNTGSNTNVNHVFQNNSANIWYMGNTGVSGVNNFRLLNSDANGNSQRLSLTQAGILTLNAYGAGTATFDASGNISSSSDERLKTNIAPYRSGLKELLKLNPITYKWNDKSGMETKGTYAGFSAQNVKSAIPFGTGQNSDGMLSLQERAIIATLVNAVKEQQEQINQLKAEIKKLK